MTVQGILKTRVVEGDQRSGCNLPNLTPLDAALAVLVALTGLLMYARTLAPSLLYGDSAELQTLSYTLGMSHPTGYPIYLLLGKLFTLLPVSNVAYRVNLLSAVFAALTLAQVYWIVRLLSGWRIAALGSALLLALSPLFWWHAVVAELYDVAAALIAAVILLVLLWRRSDDWRFLFLAGLLGGLSLGVHNTVALAAPAVLIYLLLTAGKRSAWVGAIAGAACGLGLVLAAFLFLDWLDVPSSYYNAVARPSLSVWNLSESDFESPLQRLSFILAARQFRGFFFNVPLSMMLERLQEYFALPIQDLVMLVVGCLALFFRRWDSQAGGWREGLLLLVAYLTFLGFAISYNVYDYYVFYIPSILVVHLWVGLALSAIFDGLAALLGRLLGQISMRNFRLAGAMGFLLVLALCWPARSDLSAAWQDGYAPFMQEWEIYPLESPELAQMRAKVVASKLEDNAIVFTDWDMLYAYYYVAHIEQGRTGIVFHETYPQEGVEQIADSAVAYIEANLGQRPIYFTGFVAELTHNYRFQRVAQGLYRLHTK